MKTNLLITKNLNFPIKTLLQILFLKISILNFIFIYLPYSIYTYVSFEMNFEKSLTLRRKNSSTEFRFYE